MRLALVEQRTGHQFVVALFKSLDGESVEDYTNRLFRAWKIGSKKLDDGLLFTLFQQDRRWRVEVGYGLEGTITDLEASEFGRAGVPYFASGDYAGGVRVVVDGLAARLENGPSVRPPAPAQPSLFSDPVVWIGLICIIWLILQAFLRGPTIGSSYYGGGWDGGGWGGGGGGFGGGGFSGGGGSSGGGGASGGW